MQDDAVPVMVTHDQLREARDVAADLYWKMENQFPDIILLPIRHFVFAMTLALGEDFNDNLGYEEDGDFVMKHNLLFGEVDYTKDPPFNPEDTGYLPRPEDDDEIPF